MQRRGRTSGASAVSAAAEAARVGNGFENVTSIPHRASFEHQLLLQGRGSDCMIPFVQYGLLSSRML